MNNNPLLSVIIPVHNGERFLANAIQNVQQQNYQPLEIIVINDGSADLTAKIATQFQTEIRYAYQSQQGPSAARNHGIKLAQGDLIAFLDVDDIFSEQVLADFITYLIANPQVEIVQGLIQRRQLEWSETDEGQYRFKNIFEPYQFISLGSSIFRKSVFDKVGLLDESLRHNEDTDWFLRAWEHNVAKVVLPEVMMFYNKHDRNMTLGQKNLAHFGLLQVYKRHIDRLRDRQTQGVSHPKPSIGLPDYLGQSPD